VRIGIASGLVMVGETLQAGATKEQVAVGEAPNLSARLQALAEPDTVVISDTMRAQIGDLFVYQDLGPLDIKGFTSPVRVWRVRSESKVRNRFEALHGPRISPMIGRDDELDLLLCRWERTKRGHGGISLVTGQPGIGKSRLIAALEERLEGEAGTGLRYFCAPHHKNNSLYPFISHLEEAAEIYDYDTASKKVRKLRSACASAGMSEEDVALIADALGVHDESVPVLNFTPQRKKEKTFEVLYQYIERIANERPVLMLFEDVHWADPTTLELLDLTIERISRLPLLLIMTFRSEFRTPLADRAGIDLITLRRLDRKQSRILIAQTASSAALESVLVEHIIAESDGVPLFIEELTKAVLESASQQKPAERFTSGPLTVPGTLWSSLMARLDRIPAAREIAQIGAVIGREFSYKLLAAVAQISESSLLGGLEQLVASGLIFCRGTPPNSLYFFGHALIQETAYESLLHSRVKMFHARVVQSLLELSPDIEPTQPGLLGHHCARAGLIERAALYYRCAGEQSAERAALAETREHLERGLTLVRSLTDSDARRILEIELKLAFGRVLLSTKGSADIEAGKMFEEAAVLCRGLNHIELLTRALWGYWFNKTHRRELTVAEGSAKELLRLGRAQDYAPAQLVAHTMLGITHHWLGHFEEAHSNLTIAHELSRNGAPKRLDLAIISNNIDDHVSMIFVITLTCLGYLESAIAEMQKASRRALALVHLPTRAIMLAVKCRHDWFVRDYDSLRTTATTLLTLADEQGFPFYLEISRCHLGWLAARAGHLEEGLRLLRLGLAGLQSTDALIWEPYCRGMMAEAQIFAGNLNEASRLLDDALKLSAQTGGVWFDAELHRLTGEAMLMSPTPNAKSAEESFHEAIDIARHQSAKLWELRASTSLARLWSHQGKGTAARALLGGVHAWFRHGPQTPDVKDAAAVLAGPAD
jgi:tetratricopeptide (TPR) repeat protein